ncbi:hypothetical protein R6Q59_018819 [Mikania micrantha]|uniref:Dehydrogenase E1 component domain-containing protein n=1 Tax=Mikania micrantha TaxID=192012 RepID=A0A5N6LZL0_9ASTR|nr:hypothetical protein E3N88_34945 [Mikania micrantha]
MTPPQSPSKPSPLHRSQLRASIETVDTTPKELMTFFTDMALMRRQEVMSIGMEAAIMKKDCIITTYAEPMGRQAGYSKEKGGWTHFVKKDGCFYGGHVIVGAKVSLGCGLAFAQ